MKKRILYFDALRVMACLMVIMIHVSGVYVVDYPIGGTDFIIGNVFDSISRMGVPIFVMISGAFMLDEKKQVSTKEFLKKYVLSLGIITITWAFGFAIVMDLIFAYFKSTPITFASFFNTLLHGSYHMWYLYMLIGLYLITPVLKLFVKKENKKNILYLIAILIALSFVGNTLQSFNNVYIQSVSSFFDSFMLDGMGYIAYYLIGWCIANCELSKKMKISIYSLGMVGLIYTILATHFLSKTSSSVVIAYDNISLNILFTAVAFVLFIKQMLEKKESDKASKIITPLSKLTFGVYLIHTLVIALFFNIIPESMFSLARIIIVWLLTAVVSFLITFVLSKIPFVKFFVKG